MFLKVGHQDVLKNLEIKRGERGGFSLWVRAGLRHRQQLACLPPPATAPVTILTRVGHAGASVARTEQVLAHLVASPARYLAFLMQAAGVLPLPPFSASAATPSRRLPNSSQLQHPHPIHLADKFTVSLRIPWPCRISYIHQSRSHRWSPSSLPSERHHEPLAVVGHIQSISPSPIYRFSFAQVPWCSSARSFCHCRAGHTRTPT